MPRDWSKVVDERCTCGGLKSEHAGIGPAQGHGALKRTGCPKFSWSSFVMEGDRDAPKQKTPKGKK
jgi:hypothetical protein